MEAPKMIDSELKRLRLLAHQFFAQAQTYSDLNKEKFAKFVGLNLVRLRGFFPQESWLRMRHNWVHERLRSKMYELYKTAKTRKQFTPNRIVGGTGISRDIFLCTMGVKWRELRSALPTESELVLLTLNKMVEENVPVKELTVKKLFKRAGFKPEAGGWLYKPLREASHKLKKQQSNQSVIIPPGVTAREIPGGYINLDAEVWDLRVRRTKIRKDRLRKDFADIAWASLRRELEARRLGLDTIHGHYRNFVFVADFLGNKVSDVRSTTLVEIRQAWNRCARSPLWRLKMRWALQRIFIALVTQSENDLKIDRKEMIKIVTWLQEISISRSSPDDYRLSSREADAVVDGCLADIKRGMEFVEMTPEWESMSALPVGAVNALVIVQWAVALIILLMAFTGLRRASVLNLKVGDWLELRPGVFAIAWKHGKKKEEKICLLPDIIAKLLDDYVQCTEKLRRLIGSENVFLAADCHACWGEIKSGDSLLGYMAGFVKRYKITRDDEFIKINSMILRRTYTTNELYDGRSIWLLRLQLGHDSITTTLRYAKFERFEHPNQVSSALDGWGRNVLGLWREPVLLDKLDKDERARLLGAGESRRVEGGRCRHGRCVKAESGNPPPCTLCEYLVTGPEFLHEWGGIHVDFEQEIERLRREDSSGHLLAQMRFQFEQFKFNHEYVKNASTEGAKCESCSEID
jgi:integrase